MILLRIFLTICLITIFVVIICFIISNKYYLKQTSTNIWKQIKDDPDDTKYILFWNEAYGNKRYWGKRKEPYIKADCSEKRCFGTENRSLLGNVNKFDAIVFHQRSLSLSDIPQQVNRRPEQRYMHWSIESPAWSVYDMVKLPKLQKGFFNWSMSYRVDATYFRPYGGLLQVGTLLSATYHG